MPPVIIILSSRPGISPSPISLSYPGRDAVKDKQAKTLRHRHRFSAFQRH